MICQLLLKEHFRILKINLYNRKNSIPFLYIYNPKDGYDQNMFYYKAISTSKHFRSNCWLGFKEITDDDHAFFNLTEIPAIVALSHT